MPLGMASAGQTGIIAKITGETRCVSALRSWDLW